MELNLERDYINGYDMVLDTHMTQEETLEAIVPDACPDIARIVDAVGQICLTGKNVHDAGVSVSGTVNVVVLYRAEEAADLCHMEVKLPFAFHAEAAGLHAQGQCVVTPCLRGVDVRALNPRKILARVDIGMRLQAFQPGELVLCTGVCCEPEVGVEQRTVSHMAYRTQAVLEKEFTCYDEIHLSAGPGGRAQLLSVQAQAWCSEAKQIGSKLVFKGETMLSLRYQVEGELCCVHYPVVFSQIMELPDTEENADCEVTMCVTHVECAAAGEDGRTLNVTLELLGQAVVRDQRPVRVLQDIYSTAYTMTAQQETCTLSQLMEQAVRPQNVRELLETGTAVKNVVDASVTVCETKQSREDGQATLSAELKVSVLYMDEQGQPQAFHRVLSAAGRLELPERCSCSGWCSCPGEVFAVPAAGGVEVRFQPEFHARITRQQEVPVITGARLDGSRAVGEAQPSVVLRLAAPGEELWDIAKAYSTTRECILQANRLEDDRLPTGQMILIPSKR